METEGFSEFMIVWWVEFSGTMKTQQKSFQQVRKYNLGILYY